MASNLRVDTILPSTGTTLGIGTASGTINFLGNSNITTTGSINAASATITGNLGVGGVLTYEDVTNVDSVGLITARSGINVSGGEVKVGTAVTVSSGGVITSGIVTATSFSGSGASLTGIVSGLFSSYAIIADRKSGSSDGGSISANTWTQRELNTEIADPDGIVSISNNRFTLGAGTYLIKWRCPGNRTQEFNSALYNFTDSTYTAFGESSYSYSSDGDTSFCVGMVRMTIGESKTFDIRMISQANVTASTGMGRGANMSNFNAVGGQETFTTVEIYKES